MKKRYMILYILLFVLPLFLFYLIPIRGQKEKSLVEARTLTKFPLFSVKAFTKGEYQDTLESAVSDQLIFASIIKNYNKKLDNFVSKKLSNQLIKYVDKCNVYIEVSENYYRYGCTNYLIEKPPIKYDFEETKSFFNDIKAKKYIYFIENSRSIKFNLTENIDYYELIRQNYDAEKYDKLEINSYDDYMNYFYQTDHHWNYKGSYKGYVDIIKMLSPDEKPLVPIKTTTYDVIFYGSADRVGQTSYSTEKFTVYNFDKLNYESYVDGKKRNYNGGKNNYLNNKIIKEKYLNHYGEYYGYDYGEVIFDYNQPQKENLLVFCTSFSNSIKELIASHFNKTYFIDLRHNENFDANKYIKENNIDKVLIMGDIYSFSGGDK